MAEYIKRMDTFSDEMCEGIDCGVCPFYNKAGENDCQVVAFLRSIPAADVRPVVRGRWIRHYEQADTGEDIITYPCGWVCSECGRWESEDEPFCNCGAKMEES